MLLLIEKAIVRFNIIFGNKRPLPYIRWISSSYVKLWWAFRIFPVTDCLKFRHLSSLRCPLINRLRFPFKNAFSLLLFINNFLYYEFVHLDSLHTRIIFLCCQLHQYSYVFGKNSRSSMYFILKYMFRCFYSCLLLFDLKELLCKCSLLF